MGLRNWAAIENATNAQILEWAEPQPWAREMAACNQDANWHSEGDVWTHTKMVCAEIERLSDWPALDRAAQLKLLFTALFHDSGKPATTAFDPESGRIRSLNHSLAGVQIARRVLRELDCDLATREEICGLVRFHGRPPYLLEKRNPEHEVISLSWQLNNRLLYLFAIADTRGRVAKETSRSEETLEFWKLISEERGCFEGPYPFANAHARYLFYRGQLSSLHYSPHEEFCCTATLMSGLPGAGKDTWLARRRPAQPIVSLDAIRDELEVDATENQGKVIQAAREQCREHLRARRDFAFNATNVTRQMRKRWIDLFSEYGARVQIVYVEPPLRSVLAQNSRRPVPVPESVIERLVEKLEPPCITEAHDLVLANQAAS